MALTAAKQSFARKCVPKRSLGTRGISSLYQWIVQEYPLSMRASVCATGAACALFVTAHVQAETIQFAKDDLGSELTDSPTGGSLNSFHKATETAIQRLAQGNTIQFVKDSLGLDLTNSTMGSSPNLFPGSEKVHLESFALPALAAKDKAIQWFRNNSTVAYEKLYPRRKIYYGFKEDRLVSILLSFDGFEPQSHKQLNQAWLKFTKLQGGHNGISFADDHFTVQFVPYCSPGENFWADITITGPAPK